MHRVEAHTGEAESTSYLHGAGRVVDSRSCEKGHMRPA
jgi:hypothetical protein